MTEFTLDTSGAVERPANYTGWGVERALTWTDLSPFVQGYVEALFASACGDPAFMDDWYGQNGFCLPGFSDLSPEALALILKDCERHQSSRDWGRTLDALDGRVFHQMRQRGAFVGGLFAVPPLTVSLNDEGKVELRPAS